MRNKSDKELFIDACLSNNLQDWYRHYIIENPSKIQLFSISYYNGNKVYNHKQWNPSKLCVASNEELNKDNIDVHISYWYPFTWRPIDRQLLNTYKKSEVYECQKIDCSCNDCKFLIRKFSYCFKLNKDIKINSNQCHPENQICFVHRLDKIEI